MCVCVRARVYIYIYINFKRIKKFIVDINNSGKMWIKADQYRKILHNITEKHKLNQNNIFDQINQDTYNLRNKFNIKNKLSKLNRKNVYIILQDHKQNFENNEQASMIKLSYD